MAHYRNFATSMFLYNNQCRAADLCRYLWARHHGTLVLRLGDVFFNRMAINRESWISNPRQCTLLFLNTKLQESIEDILNKGTGTVPVAANPQLLRQPIVLKGTFLTFLMEKGTHNEWLYWKSVLYMFKAHQDLVKPQNMKGNQPIKNDQLIITVPVQSVKRERIFQMGALKQQKIIAGKLQIKQPKAQPIANQLGVFANIIN